MSKQTFILTLFFLSGLLFSSPLVAQQPAPYFPYNSAGYITDMICRVVAKDKVRPILIDTHHNGELTAYNLDNAFRKSGLYVQVSGVVGYVSLKPRGMRTPFLIRKIKIVPPPTQTNASPSPITTSPIGNYPFSRDWLLVGGGFAFLIAYALLRYWLASAKVR